MKYEKIVNDTWEYLEEHYKGSEITLELWTNLINKECDNNYCLKQCIKLMWEQWEWFDLGVKNYYKKYIKNRFGVCVK